MKKNFILTIILAKLAILSPFVSANDLAEYLTYGRFGEGITIFEKGIADDGASNRTKFSLGVLQFFEALEILAQDFYRLGLNNQLDQFQNIPFLRLPIPQNPNPEIATPEEISRTLERFHNNITKVNQILQNLDENEFNTSIDISSIPIDFNSDGIIGENEYFHEIYTSYNQNARGLFKEGESLIVDFDLGDVYWLRGYSHLLLALSDFILAHEWDEVYRHTAHIFFTRVSSDIALTLREHTGAPFAVYADLIAGVHVMNLEVKSPERLVSAHNHLMQVIKCSRLSWSHIENETDKNKEWIPNPQQRGVTGVQISPAMLDGWKEFLDEFENILTGVKLVPHWRFGEGLGINIHRVFHEPKSFDLVLWIQGSAVIPYLEEGEVIHRDTWSEITSVFEGNFIGFAVWVN